MRTGPGRQWEADTSMWAYYAHRTYTLKTEMLHLTLLVCCEWLHFRYRVRVLSHKCWFNTSGVNSSLQVCISSVKPALWVTSSEHFRDSIESRFIFIICILGKYFWLHVYTSICTCMLYPHRQGRKKSNQHLSNGTPQVFLLWWPACLIFIPTCTCTVFCLKSRFKKNVQVEIGIIHSLINFA
jgi:hypothetical protein